MRKKKLIPQNDDSAIYPLTDEQISVVQESQRQVKNGNFLTDEEASKEINVWLDKLPGC
jgi:hypothetical protein